MSTNRLPELDESIDTSDKYIKNSLQPKSKETVIAELRQLREQLGLPKANKNMEQTRSILKRVGSLSDVDANMRTT